MNEEPQVLYCDAWLMAIGQACRHDRPRRWHRASAHSPTTPATCCWRWGDGFAATDVQPLNRLDRDTTGVVLFSLDKQTQPAFDQMIIDHAFEKHYLALAEGKIDWNEKLIRQAHRPRPSRQSKDARRRQRQAVSNAREGAQAS